MTVTCNVNYCPYYNSGFCSKSTLNLYGGRCEVVFNKRTGVPQYTMAGETVIDKESIIIEDYESPQQ